jgi:hypothetical protein
MMLFSKFHDETNVYLLLFQDTLNFKYLQNMTSL